MLKRTRHLVVFVLILIGGTIPIQAKDSTPPVSKEHKIKAAYLYNYLKTIGWPENLPPAMREHMILGILGTNPFGNNLEQLKAKTAQGKPIKVLLFGPFTALQQQQESSETTEPNHPRLQDMASCHVLFVTQSETSHLPAIQEVVGTQPVLIVGEDEGFLKLGGIINFVVGGKRGGFEIHLARAKALGLTVSSKLLRLAERVFEEETQP